MEPLPPPILISILSLLIILLVVFFVKGKKKMKNLNLIPFTIGILLALTSAVLMFLGILPLPARITIGIIGIALIATSKFRLLK
jgi:glucan phosphoethanolaminetransferase (alkaline phosphatase superfamily)